MAKVTECSESPSAPANNNGAIVAQKRGGPRTKLGKARSARNAITHGICSNALLLEGESKAEFNALRNGLRKDCRPKGALQELLFNNLVSLFWQLQRLRKAELAEIQAITEFVEWDESERNRLDAARLPLVGCGLKHWIANPEALQGCLDLLHELKQSICKDGFDPEYDNGILTKLYGSIEERSEKESWKKTLFDRYLSWLTFSQYSEEEREENAYPLSQECRENFLQELNDEIRRLERYRQESVAISERRLQLEALRRSIPEGSRLDQLLRYEASKWRQIEKTVKLLQDLQGTQLGLAVPPPINVSVTTEKE